MTSTLKRTARTLPMRELTSAAVAPIATVHANLMPTEVLDKRRLRWLKRRLAFTLGALLLLVGFGYALVRQQTSTVSDDLDTAHARTATLQRQVGGFADLTVLQTQIAQIRTQLTGAMAGDVQWSALLSTLNAQAPRGLVVSEVRGSVTDPSAAGGAAAPAAAPTDTLTGGGRTVVGTLELSGTATDYRQVASFVDRLGTVRGIVAVDPGSVSSDQGRASYTISASLTEDVRGGRFTPRTASPTAAAPSTGVSR